MFYILYDKGKKLFQYKTNNCSVLLQKTSRYNLRIGQMMHNNHVKHSVNCVIKYKPSELSFVLNKLNLSAMLKWTAIFLVIALIAAMFGFTGIAESAASIAKFIFFVFITLVVVTGIIGLFFMK